MLLLACLSVLTAATDDTVQAALDAERRIDPERALELFDQAARARPDDAFLQQKLAKQYSDLVPLQSTPDARRQFALSALSHAQRAVALQPDSAVNVASLAICHGHLALVSSTREKVTYSRSIKEECERALQLDPDYAWAHHLLGRWHLEVAAFGGTARFFARILYGGLPAASNEEAYRHLKRATELAPRELNHWIELGFAAAATGRPDEARACWERGIALPRASTHDDEAKARARAALAR